MAKSPKQKKFEAAIRCSIALERAIRATRNYYLVASQIDNIPTYADDSRLVLIEKMTEYWGYVDKVAERLGEELEGK